MKLYKRAFPFLLALILLAGCAGRQDGGRTIIDGDGCQVVIPAQVRRVACLSKILNMVASLDDVENIAYISKASYDCITDFARLMFDGIEDIRVIENDASVEELLAMDFDVAYIIDPETAESYRRAGIPAVVLSTYSIDELISCFDLIGEISGGEAARRAEYFREHTETILKKVASVIPKDPEERPTVYYLNANAGIDPCMTDGAHTLFAECVEAAGGKLAIGERGRNFAVTAESLLSADPDFIVVGETNQAQAYDALPQSDLARGMSALRDGNVYLCPCRIFHWARAGIETPLFILWLASVLYPDAISSAQVADAASAFYRDMYGKAPDADSIAAVLAGREEFNHID